MSGEECLADFNESPRRLEIDPSFLKSHLFSINDFSTRSLSYGRSFERLGGREVVVQKVGVVAFKSIQLVINSTVNYRSPSLPPFRNTCSFDKGRAPCSVRLFMDHE